MQNRMMTLTRLLLLLLSIVFFQFLYFADGFSYSKSKFTLISRPYTSFGGIRRSIQSENLDLLRARRQRMYATRTSKDDVFALGGGVGGGIMTTSGLSNSRMGSTRSSSISGKTSNALLETDYLGMIDFCLRPSDSALSDISRSKVLNELTNLIFRCLMIGYHPAIDNVVKQLDTYRKEVSDAACTLRQDDKRILGTSKRIDEMLDEAKVGVTSNVLSIDGDDNDSNNNYDSNSDSDSSEMTSRSSSGSSTGSNHKNFPTPSSSSTSSSSNSKLQSKNAQSITAKGREGEKVRDGEGEREGDAEYYTAACSIDEQKAIEYINKLEKLLTTGETDESIQGGIYDRGYKRLLTVLKDAGCVFYNDKAIASNTATSASSLATTASSFSNSSPFSSSSSSSAPSTSTSTSASASASASASLTSRRPRSTNSNICLSIMDLQFPSKRTKTKDLNQISNCVSRAMLYGTRSDKRFLADAVEGMIPDFVNEWCNGNESSQEILYLRALIMLLRESFAGVEAAVTYSGTPSSKVFGFSNISASVTSFVDTMPAAVAGGGEGVGNSASSSNSHSLRPNLRLHDAYLNAFQRVVEMCLTEIGTRAGRNLPQNEDILYNFLNWEKELRLNLTAPVWRSNPTELVGEWELMDVLGDGSLGPIMTSDSFFGMGVGVMIELKIDGNVDVKMSSGTGQSWTFTPGPAHLDTCSFSVVSSTKPNLLLKYVGFIDRGQRIESRFSRQPIRMTGRVISVVNGEPCGSCRFIMMKKRTKEIMRLVRSPLLKR